MVTLYRCTLDPPAENMVLIKLGERVVDTSLLWRKYT